MLKHYLSLLLLLLSFTAAARVSQQPLPPEEAFRFSAQVVDQRTIEATWRIADGYYIYRDKIKFTATPASLVLGAPQFPPGQMKQDPLFGHVEVYTQEVKLRIPIQSGSTAEATLKATSQGCWEQGICYPPLEQETVLTAAPETMSGGGKALPVSENETNRIASALASSGFWANVFIFFGAGLLLAFTPCVFPMVPILSGIIIKHGHALTHARAFLLSLAYVLGMAVTYACIGVLAGFSGLLLSAALQNVWVLSAAALLFVALALSMFGFYNVQLPTCLQNKLSVAANRQGGSLSAIALMGAISALIVGPCVVAPLAGAIIYIAKTKDIVLGGATLFSLALGMGVPLLAVGVFSRTFLPKAGSWMQAVNKFFGVLMLAVALWLISSLLPTWLLMLACAALLIVPAIYLHALDPLPPHAGGWSRFWKGVGVLLLISGALMLIGVLGGGRDPLQPLSFLASSGYLTPGTAAAKPQFERVESLAALKTRLAASDKPVMLDFYADWCVSCKELEKFTFADARVAKRLQEFTWLQADVTANNAADAVLLKHFGLVGPPAILFFDRTGDEINQLRVIGFLAADDFLAVLQRADTLARVRP